MGSKHDSKFCPHCKTQVMAVGTTPNHLLHFVLCIFTAGLWIPIWILVALGKIGGYRCSQCGAKV